MIYAFTSKKSGCGRSAIALMTSLLVADSKNNSTILLDLSRGADLYSLISNQRTLASVDGLISGVTIGDKDLNLSNNLLNIKNLNIVPGTRSRIPGFLYKRYLDVKAVLSFIDNRFNSVIIDVDEDLLTLLEYDLEIKRINVLEQDILNVQKYQSEISTNSFNGVYVVNNFREHIFPQFNFFSRNFSGTSLFVVPYDSEIASVLNRSDISCGVLKKSSCYEGIVSLSKMIIDDASVIDTAYLDKYSKGSILDIFFGRRKSTSKNPKVKKNIRKNSRREAK